VAENTVWKVREGPFGRGDALVRALGNQTADVIAPPGVPLNPPERMSDLLQWRVAKFMRGRITKRPRVVSLDEAKELAPSQAEWIQRQVEDLAERERAIRALPEHEGLWF
jgi:hypothetical protein